MGTKCCLPVAVLCTFFQCVVPCQRPCTIRITIYLLSGKITTHLGSLCLLHGNIFCQRHNQTVTRTIVYFDFFHYIICCVIYVHGRLHTSIHGIILGTFSGPSIDMLSLCRYRPTTPDECSASRFQCSTTKSGESLHARKVREISRGGWLLDLATSRKRVKRGRYQFICFVKWLPTKRPLLIRTFLSARSRRSSRSDRRGSCKNDVLDFCVCLDRLDPSVGRQSGLPRDLDGVELHAVS